MLHEPAVKEGKDKASAWKASLGIKLFALYGMIYAVFVGISVFGSDLMKKPVFLGVNLSILYGAGLILFAIFLGVIYNHVCTRKENEMNASTSEVKS
jgi:uncharacterized membrane protein (DUF485 family)